MFNRKAKPHLVLAETMLREAREELSRADGKSSLLLAAVGVVVGAVAAAVVAGEWSPFDLSPFIQWLWWAGNGAGIGSLVAWPTRCFPEQGIGASERPRSLRILETLWLRQPITSKRGSSKRPNALEPDHLTS